MTSGFNINLADMAAMVDLGDNHGDKRRRQNADTFKEWTSNNTGASNDDVPPLVGDEIPTIFTPPPAVSSSSASQCLGDAGVFTPPSSEATVSLLLAKSQTQQAVSPISVQQRLRDAMVSAKVLGGNESRPFLPMSKAKEIITADVVKGFLPDLDLQTQVVDKYFKVCSILAFIGKAEHISSFIAGGVSDSHLPFRPVQSKMDKSTHIQSESRPDMLFKPYLGLDQTTLFAFLKNRWAFCPYYFSGPDPHTSKAPFDDLGRDTILPFTSVERFNSGSFGTVHRVQILDEYCNFPVPKKRPHYFAIKELHSMDNQNWSREMEVLQSLNGEAHPNIIRLLSAYKLGGKMHLLFDWADSDLGMFWRLNPDPILNTALSLWMSREMLGLLDGLSLLHNCTKDDSPKRWFGRHGDIKPSNILVFKANTGDHLGQHQDSVLKIADFGLASFHKADAETHTAPAKHTPAYRAPELHLKPQENSSSYDIWSLGCLLSEFIAWSVGGCRALDQLASARADTISDAPSFDAWFHLEEVNGGDQVAELKPWVKHFFGELRHHPHATDFIRDVLDMVQQMMLVVDPQKRSSSRDIYKTLAQMYKKLEDDELYSTPRCDCALPRAHGNWLADSTDDQCLEHEHLLKMVYSKTSSQHNGKRKRPDTDGTTESNNTSRAKKLLGAKFEETSSLPRRFVCPCLRAGVDRAQLSRSCFGPGWIEIHRLKEHICRCHTPENFRNPSLVCPRCLEGFESQALLMQHQRQEQCLIKATEIINGRLNLEQVNNLRSTKRKSELSDEEKWFEYYRILFPSHDLPSSPYHEDLTMSSINTLSTQSSTGMSEYRDYIKRPLSEDKQQRIEAALAAKGIPPEYRKIMAASFRDLQCEDLQEFNQDKLNPAYDIPLDDNVLKVDTAPEADVDVLIPDEDINKYFEEWDNDVLNWAS
ncbi:hypothetical protein QQX98_002471 [Neonectria punicea]|uniref:Protein kinase domain-containing protein n=1 Tax=Neonectria punicea TaxID=979145 RepID=A0ABR1HIU6_9HYPO